MYPSTIKTTSIIMLVLFLVACGGSGSKSSRATIKGTHNNADDTQTDASLTEQNTTKVDFGLSYPPVQEWPDRAFTLKQLKALNLNRVRFDDVWQYREPEKGFFNWQPLDERMDWLHENDISVLLTIQPNGPDWACDSDQRNERYCAFLYDSDFTDYIQALLQRFPNEIEQIQFGNEWLSEYWFAGTAEQFVQYTNIVYTAVQTYSPDTKVVLGGLASGDLSGLAFCEERINHFYRDSTGERVDSAQRSSLCNSETALDALSDLFFVLDNAYYDIIDIHLYDDVENWEVYLQTIRSFIGNEVPVVVSEFGGPNLKWEPYSDDFQAQRLETYLTTLNRMNVEAAYYFKLVQSKSALESHWESGLYKIVDGEYVKKPAFDTFQRFSNR